MNKHLRFLTTYSLISWSVAWVILAIKLDFWTAVGFILFGSGLSGLTIIFTLMIEKLLRKERENIKPLTPSEIALIYNDGEPIIYPKEEWA
jgi:hypothetical protein